MSKKMTAYLKEENLLTLLSQNNFIVPEIQREYVWGENEKVIVKFKKLNQLETNNQSEITSTQLKEAENLIVFL
jgi:uncharacterized protein with ParB-like and HNH nuclease domain